MVALGKSVWFEHMQLVRCACHLRIEHHATVHNGSRPTRRHAWDLVPRRRREAFRRQACRHRSSPDRRHNHAQTHLHIHTSHQGGCGGGLEWRHTHGELEAPKAHGGCGESNTATKHATARVAAPDLHSRLGRDGLWQHERCVSMAPAWCELLASCITVT